MTIKKIIKFAEATWIPLVSSSNPQWGCPYCDHGIPIVSWMHIHWILMVWIHNHRNLIVCNHNHKIIIVWIHITSRHESSSCGSTSAGSSLCGSTIRKSLLRASTLRKFVLCGSTLRKNKNPHRVDPRQQYLWINNEGILAVWIHKEKILIMWIHITTRHESSWSGST